MPAIRKETDRLGVSRFISVSILTLIVTAAGLAQTFRQEPTIGELQKQLEEMRSQMVKMQNRIEELEAARGIPAASPSTDPVLPQSQTPRVQDPRSQTDETKSSEEPTSFHLKGLTLTPGGFWKEQCWCVLAMKTQILRTTIHRFR